MKIKLAIVSIIFIIFGFGIIHGESATRELAGNIMIGLGSLYLVSLAIISILKSNKESMDN